MDRFVYFKTEDKRSGSLVNNERKKSFITRNMDGPLSGYWVKFFKNAGFSSEVATRHAVIFSNNRIQPDMLPDLDKPSLKDMGISLMGDMIAILRYAKKVVEETSCKKIMVSSEDLPTASKSTSKPVVKKIVTKAPAKSATATTKVKLEAPIKIIKTAPSSTVKQVIVPAKKKLVAIPQTSRMYSDYIDTTQRPKSIPLKRKYNSDEEEEEEEEEGIDGKWVHNDTNKRFKSTTNNVQYKVLMPKETAEIRSQKILKKALEQKRTVFNRLGDSMVSSTTNVEFSNSNVSPTFTVTGVVGKDMHKRNSSVFNRLGNKDGNPDDITINRSMRNGNTVSATHGILKTRTPLLGTKVIATKSVMKKVGTMRADEEAHKKTVSERVEPMVKPTTLRMNNSMRNNLIRTTSVRHNPIGRKLPISGKLASDSIALSAKSRLGRSKQVTFNKLATISHVRKQGVFSRLGI